MDGFLVISHFSRRSQSYIRKLCDSYLRKSRNKSSYWILLVLRWTYFRAQVHNANSLLCLILVIVCTHATQKPRRSALVLQGLIGWFGALWAWVLLKCALLRRWCLTWYFRLKSNPIKIKIYTAKSSKIPPW